MDANVNSATSHPLYERARAQMEAGDWAGALTSLRMLRASFPFDPDLERLQAVIETQLADSNSLSEGDTGTSDASVGRRRWLRLLGVLLALLLGGGLLLAMKVAYGQLVEVPTPVVEHQAEVEQARQTVRLALSSGDCRWAEEAYRDLLRYAPEDRVLEMGLARCKERLALDALYAEGVAALNAGDWQAARMAFETLAQQAPGYRDLTDQESRLEHRQQIEEWWSEAQSACQAEDWQTCVAHLQAVQQGDVHFRRDEVEALLHDAALEAGRELVMRSGQDRDLLAQASAYFELALRQEPASQEALLEWKLAGGYARALGLVEQQDWEAAAEELASLYEIRPGYAGGQLAQLLYHAWFQLGQGLAAQGDSLGALAAYRRAIEVEGVDTRQAQTAFELLEAMLTPLPTPSDTPTPSPTPTVAPSATPRPRPRPTAAPSPTPTPLPYRFFSYGATLTADTTCNSLTVQGWVRDDVYPMPGVEVTIWTDSWSGPMVITDRDGYYYYFLDDHPKLGTWYIKLSMGGEQISDVVTFSTRPDCDSNLVYISWESRY